jgi:hypothetical protein
MVTPSNVCGTRTGIGAHEKPGSTSLREAAIAIRNMVVYGEAENRGLPGSTIPALVHRPTCDGAGHAIRNRGAQKSIGVDIPGLGAERIPAPLPKSCDARSGFILFRAAK